MVFGQSGRVPRKEGVELRKSETKTDPVMMIDHGGVSSALFFRLLADVACATMWHGSIGCSPPFDLALGTWNLDCLAYSLLIAAP